MKNSDITLEQICCPVCSAESAKEIFRRPDHAFQVSSYAFPVVKCINCGMGYVKTRPSAQSLHAFYPAEFYKKNHTEAAPVLHKKLNLLNKFTTKGTLLDIGCAGGEFIHHASQNGWEAYGYEWSSTPPNHFSGRIAYGESPLEAYEGKSFSAITAWAVMEHAHNLQSLTRDISKLLAPGGIFVCLVTNFNSLPARFMQRDDIPRHLNLFTKSSLTRLLKEHHMSPIHWDFGNEIFSGSHLGLLVFLAKRLAGESIETIVEQHRAPGQRSLFCNTLYGSPSRMIKALCRLDKTLTPGIDFLASKLNAGLTMTVIAKKNSADS